MTTDPSSAATPTGAEEWVPRRYGYCVGSFGFLVGESIRSEVVRAPVVSPLPHSPEWLLGLLNLRGNLVPVADLRTLCGESPASSALSTVLVLDSGEKAVAIPIDALPSALTELRPVVAPPPLPPSLEAHAGPAYEADGRAWFAFNHEEFFRALARGPGAQS